MRINMLESLTDNIVIDKDKCTFCGICIERCVLDNLRMKLSPCRQACPLGLNCHGYVQLIARGEDVEGLKMVWEKLPFPGTEQSADISCGADEGSHWKGLCL